jgi:hypothetical protein
MKNFTDYFSEADLDLLRKQEMLKAELARIEESLKPVINKAVRECGDGEVNAYGCRFSLKKTTRVSPKWKGIAEHYLTEDQITAVMDDYATISTFCTLKEITPAAQIAKSAAA